MRGRHTKAHGRLAKAYLSGGNIRIMSGSYFEHEGSCAINGRQRVGAGRRLSLACEGEGETWKKSVTVSATGDTLAMDGSRLVRCKGRTQPPNWPVGQ